MHLKTSQSNNAYFLLNQTIKKSDVHIHLIQRPSKNWSKRHNGSHGSIHGNRRKGLLIINSLSLGESSCYKHALVLLHATINNIFYLVQPPGINCWLTLWSRHNLLPIIFQYGVIFLYHSILSHLLCICLLKTRSLHQWQKKSMQHIRKLLTGVTYSKRSHRNSYLPLCIL